ncbi:hypothetical protein DLM86_15745 [Paenibacillus flagellatus]|uniref:Uncharacterized protein n=1 Tax=Paenibacillus flagellatus TaxID=2211139 RepID=A0A2V5K3Z6_9BACL|nr:hypothetical protein DLM86_15745 [Paenibacillus flagellatus]
MKLRILKLANDAVHAVRKQSQQSDSGQAQQQPAADGRLGGTEQFPSFAVNGIQNRKHDSEHQVHEHALSSQGRSRDGHGSEKKKMPDNIKPEQQRFILRLPQHGQQAAAEQEPDQSPVYGGMKPQLVGERAGGEHALHPRLQSFRNSLQHDQSARRKYECEKTKRYPEPNASAMTGFLFHLIFPPDELQDLYTG